MAVPSLQPPTVRCSSGVHRSLHTILAAAAVEMVTYDIHQMFHDPGKHAVFYLILTTTL